MTITEKVKHTGGPWESQGTAGHDKHGQSVVYAEDGGRGTDIAIVYDGDANARLIAASPEMLSALEIMVYERKIGMASERAMQLAEAAIRRAKGE